MRARRLARRSRRDPRPRWRRILDLATAAAILAVLLVVAARLERVASLTLSGRPAINDGDTITLAGERLRLRGIDAPEIDQICRGAAGDYACGRRARQELRALMGAGPVDCRGWERDRYGRILATCVAGGTDLNGAMVEAGWAVAYGDYEGREAAARAGRRGVWAGAFDQPRDWRQRRGAAVDPEHDVLGMLLNWLRAVFRQPPIGAIKPETGSHREEGRETL